MKKQAADVVVLGAGVVGASVAYHLAARGCTDVLVLDREPEPGRGSTCRATGGFRAHFGSDVNVRLSLLAREKLRAFPDELGVDSGYRPYGYLFVAREQRGLDALAEAREVQRAAGFDEAVMVDPDEIRRLNPAIAMDGVIGGSYCAADGFIRPLEILRGYGDGARRLGARFSFGEPCTGFRMQGRRISAVVTPRGEIATGCVVNAAGPWAAQIGRLVGADVPVTPLRRQVALTEPCNLLPETMPMTIFVEDGFHLRVRDGRVLLLWPDHPAGGDPFDTRVDEGWLAEVVRMARERVPCLASVGTDVEGCWGGLYENSPDGHALLGAASGVDNLFLANGSSGHGVMHAPALGQLLAEIILDGAASTLDTRPLRPTRFIEGQPNRAPEPL
jgi:sarcosine oxidase subunit beta